MELEKLTGNTIPVDEFKDGFCRLTLTHDPIKDSLLKSAQDAFEVGFFDENPDLSEIYDFTLLNEVLKEKGLEEIAE